MKVLGYKLKSYDAVFEETMFLVSEHPESIEIEDINTGTRFILPKKELRRREKSKHRTHRKSKNAIQRK